MSDGEIRQVHLFIGHWSINSFASPQNEARFKMAIGIVSLDERNEELIFRTSASTYWSRRPGRGYRQTRVICTPGQTFPPRRGWTRSSAATPLLHLCKWSALAVGWRRPSLPKSQSKSWNGSSQEDSTTYPTMMPKTLGHTSAGCWQRIKRFSSKRVSRASTRQIPQLTLHQKLLPKQV